MSINEIRASVEQDLFAVEQAIYDLQKSDVTLINQIACYLMDNGGKRLRPLTLLLSADACNYHGKQHIPLATAIEFIHSATLLHDDVVDASTLRRGQPSAHVQWGNASSILVGDFLYSRAFQLLVQAGDLKILDIFAKATNKIAEGEAQQLMNRHNPDLSEHHYLDVLQSKTGKLFEVASHVGAVLAGVNEETEQAMREYGMHLGTAFQLIDDVLDYTASSEVIGKNIGDDLAEGSPTLPLLYAMHNTSAERSAMIKHAIESGDVTQLEQIQIAIRECGALEYTRRIALQETDKALTCLHVLEESASKVALADLARFAIHRKN